MKIRTIEPIEINVRQFKDFILEDYHFCLSGRRSLRFPNEMITNQKNLYIHLESRSFLRSEDFFRYEIPEEIPQKFLEMLVSRDEDLVELAKQIILKI